MSKYLFSVVHVYSGISAVKRNETGSFIKTLMDLESVIQSEVSQKEKNKYHVLKDVCGI